MKVIVATWEGGGHTPPALLVARRLQDRGAEVLVVSDEATRATADGLRFEAWKRAPSRSEAGSASDPLKDWRAVTPIGVVKAVCDAVMCGPALAYARDTLDLIEHFRPDAIVANELLFGVMAAAEARKVKLALLTGNLWCFPTRADLPPFGPAFAPAKTEFQRRRERMARRWIHSLYDAGLHALNTARREIGLAPLLTTLAQLDCAQLILVGTAKAFDFGDAPPAPFVYAGPLGAAPGWTEPPQLDFAADDRPLVLISFSTTFQNEARILQRAIDGIARLPVRGLVTLGPALTGVRLSAPPSVTVLERASHDQIVPHCAAVICHGGHGTVMRPLMHGVPVVCLPTGRDQPENAVRIVERGAGLSLRRSASPAAIAAAARRVLTEPSFRISAERLGRAIRAEDDGGKRAAEAIEALGRGAT